MKTIKALFAAVLVSTVFAVANPASAQEGPYDITDPSYLVNPGNPGKLVGGGTFTDDDGNTHESRIEAVFAHSVTSGCTLHRYCPSDSVTRGQMATFLVRALKMPMTQRPRVFSDTQHNPHETAINMLAHANIVAGTTDGRFLPDASVSREAMATFLGRALRLAPGPVYFIDVSGPHSGYIGAIAAANITQGCTADRFCPGADVKRDQMATFLSRGFNLGSRSVPTRVNNNIPTRAVAKVAGRYNQMPNRSVDACATWGWFAGADMNNYEWTRAHAIPACRYSGGKDATWDVYKNINCECEGYVINTRVVWGTDYRIYRDFVPGHEYIHTQQSRVSGGFQGVPGWVFEGHAQFLSVVNIWSANMTSKSPTEAWSQAAYYPGNLEGYGVGSGAYYAGAAAWMVLHDRHGAEKAWEFFERLRHVSFSRAFSDVFRQTPAQFYADFDRVRPR